MALKSVFAAVCCAAILAAGSSWADEYRPDEFLTAKINAIEALSNLLTQLGA